MIMPSPTIAAAMPTPVLKRGPTAAAFDHHKERERRDPDEVHDPEDEEERHQQRATAEAIEPMRKAQTRRAGPAGTTEAHQKR